MNRQDPDLFTGVRPPRLPPGLKPRMLAHARARTRSDPPLVDRLWESRGLRLAGAATVAVRLAAHLRAMPRISPSDAGPAPTAAAIAGADADLAPFLARHRIRDPRSSSPLGGRLFLPPVQLEPLS